ncbi:hypothetical protein CRUP_023876 [Coryphaenoides rupestris]|nr:hypothetical protein CRUP_023876 [Coryphaenoides rupestris]
MAGVGLGGGGARGGGLGLSLAGVGPRCEGRACNPRMGNLVLGRRVLTQTVCGLNATERYCTYHADGPSHGSQCSASPPKCAKCNAALPHLAHLAGAMADSSFRHPDTWWQSAEGAEPETLQLDLETEFYVTHLILVFRSPRPAAMTLERSRDFGHTWSPLQRYAADCSATFGPEGEQRRAEEEEERKAAGGRRRRMKGQEVPCTTKYSGAYPCTRGEVRRSRVKSLDPFGAEAREQLTVTNLRVRLLQHQPCPCQAKSPAPSQEGKDEAPPTPTRHFAIYDFIVKGSCLCNGHAEQCGPPRVHGRCVCRHNTAGDHCQRCAPLYNERPWQPADGLTGAPHECQTCGCHPMGSLPFHSAAGHTPPGDAPCDPANGECMCKPGVGGARCDRCMVGYWGLHVYGCRPCDCAGDCDSFTGDCVPG